MSQQVESKFAEARARGFSQGVHALQRIMYGTPAGWALAAWLAHGRVPVGNMVLWLGLFATGWVLNLALLRGIERNGSHIERHSRWLWAVALIDGVCWGLVVVLLMTHDRFLDAWLAVLLCGVVSVNMPVYITIPSAFRVLLFALWVTVCFGADRLVSSLQLVVGMLVYFVVLAYTLGVISVRVIEGLQLQLENAALAKQLREALAQMEHQATTDALTGQMNRRALDLALDRSVEMAHSRGHRFSILMLDIDHFKMINDTHGHHVGDQALRAVADRVASQLRVGDGCARYGGEEFVVLLPEATQDQAREVAERIRQHIADGALPTEPPLWATASLGVAECEPGMGVDKLLAAADSAVYVAKRSGRNRVCVADPLPAAGGSVAAGTAG